MSVEQWASSTRELVDEARLIGGDYVAQEPGFYVAFELNATTASTERGLTALEADDHLTALMHTRLIIEIAIRLAWVKAPIKQRDRTAIATRLRRVVDQDIRVFLAADDAVRKHGGFPMITNRDAIMVQVEQIPQKWDVPLAPSKLEVLASEAQQPALYAAYRYTSTLAHAGIGQKLTTKAPEHMYWQYLRFGHAAAALHGVALLEGLGLLVEPAPLPLNEAAFHAFGRLEADS